MKHTPLRYLARIQNSNVDKVIEDGETPIRLCNYVHVFRNDKITADMTFDQGSATKLERKVFALNPGDVIITKDSEDPREIGVPALVVSSAEDIVCGYHLTILRPNEGVHGPYLYYGLCSKIAQEQFMLSARGITRFGLNQDGIGGCAIPLPSMEEQLAIARMLDEGTRHIDDLIAEKSGFIALLREKRFAAVSSLVRQGNGVLLEDTGIEWRGRAPVSWTRSKLKALFKQAKRQGHNDLNVLSVYRDYGVIEKSSRDDNINKTPENLSTYQLVEPGDLVINKMKAWQGSMGISDYRGITSPDYVVMTPKTDANPRYLHHYLRARPMPWVYRQISNGIRTDQWRLEPEKFLDLPIFLPSQEEQTKIADAIDSETTRIDGLIHETEHSIALLKEKRAALITAAVTGKIDVRNAA